MNSKTKKFEQFDPTEGKGKKVGNIVDPQKWVTQPMQPRLEFLGREKNSSSGGSVHGQSAMDVIWNFLFNSGQNSNQGSSQKKEKEKGDNDGVK